MDDTVLTSLIRSRRAQFALVCWAAPFVAYLPYHWWVFQYAKYYIVTPAITDPEYRAVHLSAWFAFTFTLFTVGCAIVGGVFLGWALLSIWRRSIDTDRSGKG